MLNSGVWGSGKLVYMLASVRVGLRQLGIARLIDIGVDLLKMNIAASDWLTRGAKKMKCASSTHFSLLRLNCPTSQSASLLKGRLRKYFSKSNREKYFWIPLTGADELRYNG